MTTVVLNYVVCNFQLNFVTRCDDMFIRYLCKITVEGFQRFEMYVCLCGCALNLIYIQTLEMEM